MRPDARHTRGDVEDVILDVLEHRGVTTTAEIYKLVKDRLNLSAADRQTATKRDGESKVDQVIANALQARRRLCRDGLIERVDKGEFRIGAAGQKHLQKHHAETAKMAETLSEMFTDSDLE